MHTLISFILLMGTAANAADRIQGVVAGGVHSCLYTESKLRCFGQNMSPDVLEVAGLKQVALGYAHVCMLDVDGVWCWGDNQTGETMVPQLRNPRAIASGERHVCAVDADGVQCWGRKEEGQGDAPRTLEDVGEISAGSHHTCAIDRIGVHCWGKDTHGETQVPKGLRNPRQLAVGVRHSCVLTDDGMRCWGDVDKGVTPSHLEGVSQVSVGGYSTCVIVKGKVKCFNYKNIHGLEDVPPLKNPESVATGWQHACAVHDGGKSVKCWGRNQYGEASPPRIEEELLSIETHQKLGKLRLRR